MALSADTDGDLRAVRTGKEDDPGTPAEPADQDDSSRADFAGVSSHELATTARRLIDALARRADETASTELRSLYESLSQTIAEPSHPVTHDDAWSAVERTAAHPEPVWDRWFR